MTAYREKTLDVNAAKIKPTIYEVDGLRGTLKELADYFMVDPIEVSDMLLAGISIEDALCRASSLKVPGVKKNRPVVKKAAGKEKIKVHTGRKKVAIETPSEKMKKVSQKKVKVAPVEETVGFGEKKKSVDVVKEQVSAFTTTDVKDLGDLILVTTTTTTVYRKGV